MSMTASLRATSTTLLALHGVNVTISEDTESTSAGAYIIGFTFFTLLFACGFVLTCCQIRGNNDSDKSLQRVTLSSAREEADSDTTKKPPLSYAASTSLHVGQQPKLGSGDLDQMMTSRNCHSSAPLDGFLSASELTLPAAEGCPIATEPHFGFKQNLSSGQVRLATHASPGLRAAAYSKSDRSRWHDNRLGESSPPLGSWVESSEWTSARASRKRQVEGVAPPGRQNVPLPSLPAPTLDVPGGIPAGFEDDTSWASCTVSDQLRSTASEHMSLRKKTFKGLCARWHPDKNTSGNIQLATAVFQYLQAQKAWYLGDHESPRTQPRVSVC